MDTEHLLLGLIREGQGIAARALQELDVDLERLEIEISRMMRRANSVSDGSKRPPIFTRASTEVIRSAHEEAEKIEEELNTLPSSGVDEETGSKVKAALEAKEKASRAARRAAKALAKAEDAARAAEELGAPLHKQEEPGESPDEDNGNSSPQRH